MAQSSQVAKVQAIGDIAGLAHEIFASGVKVQCLANSPTAQLFNKAQRKADYDIRGEALVGAARLSFSNGAMATAGDLPDHQFRDAKNWQTTPVRRYRRIAMDNLVKVRGSGAGAFKDLGAEIFDQLWDSWSRMEIRHAIGDARGYVALCSSRTDADTIVVKAGYGHTGCHPLLHIEIGTVLAWLDASAALVAEGAAKVSAITYSTKTIDFATAFDDGVTTITGDDPIVMATTTFVAASGPSSVDYFETEYNNAPHGLMGIIDPDANYTTVLNIAESGNERWKPLKETSATFDQYEVTEHWRKLRARSTSPVNAQSHVAITQGAVVAELARTLGPFQQQSNLGRTFEGGYQAVRIANMDFVEDDFSLQDVLFTVCTEDLYRADIGGDADFYDEDGAQWSRSQDHDSQEAFVREYMQTWADRRNRMGALKAISLPNVNEDDFTPVPA